MVAQRQNAARVLHNIIRCRVERRGLYYFEISPASDVFISFLMAFGSLYCA